jgi:phosphatidylglycerol---prolipoprotein diacylglyceryl transferase
MINPIIFSFNMGGLVIALRWYGVLAMTGASVSAWFASREIARHGENGDAIWDLLVWLLPAGIIGARLWYVANATFGGNSYYLQNPIKIFYVWEGGLHIYGGFVLGILALYFYLRKHKMDFWLFLDAIAPMTLLGQAIARPANFINQELYGPPTTLPWGIPIDAAHRLAAYADLAKYPLESTRFHPVFAYEMIWNFLAVGLLLYISHRFADKVKPGTIFFSWLMVAGLGRFLIEFLRPDQPLVGNTWLTTTQVATLLMMLVGGLLLAYRYGKLKLPLPALPERYQIAGKT